MKVKLDRVEYKENSKNLRLYNEGGAAGCIYKDESRNKAVKIVHSDILLKKILLLSSYDELQEYNVVVPEEEVYIEGNPRGYTMEFIEGMNLIDIWMEVVENNHDLSHYFEQYISNLSIHRNFMEIYLEALQNVEKISECSIYMSDMNMSNIMFDLKKERLAFIDVDWWEKGESLGFNKSLIKKMNLGNFKSIMRVE